MAAIFQEAGAGGGGGATSHRRSEATIFLILSFHVFFSSPSLSPSRHFTFYLPPFFLCVCRASNNGPDVHWPLLMTQNREILVAHEYPDSWTLEKIKKTANGCAIDPSIHRSIDAFPPAQAFLLFLVISKLFPVSFIHCDRLRTC